LILLITFNEKTMTNKDDYFDQLCTEFKIYNAHVGGLTLGDVPEDRKTKQMCQICLADHPGAIKYIPKKWRTRQMWLDSLSKDASLLKNIPDAYKTYHNCLNAVIMLGCTLEYVPKKWRTAEMCIASVSTEGPSGYNYIPKKIRLSVEHGPVIHKLAAKNDGYSFLNFPEKYRNRENSWLAVKSHCYAFEKVPVKYQTHELMLEATRKEWNGYYINNVLRYFPQIRTLSFANFCQERSLYDKGARAVLRFKRYCDKNYAMCPEVDQWKWT